MWIFCAKRTGTKTAVTLQDGETVAFRWAREEEFRTLDKTNLVTTRMQIFRRSCKNKDKGVDRICGPRPFAILVRG